MKLGIILRDMWKGEGASFFIITDTPFYYFLPGNTHKSRII